MIRIDFSESVDGPTLWVIIDRREDFVPFRELILDLSDGTLDEVELRSRPELFLLWPHIANVELAAVAPSMRNGITVLGGEESCKLSWKLSGEDWNEVLDKVDALNHEPPNGHQYFDYRNVTVVVSFMEKLRDVPFPSSRSKSELKQ
ncbi:MAG: hypothetical protein WBQ08_21305 [Candidatus Sulfotelmatobacter sp.]